MTVLSDLRLARAPLASFFAMGVLWGTYAADLPDIKTLLGVDESRLGQLMLATPLAALTATLPAIGHFHVSENDRGTPGRGHAAIRPALGALKAAGYDHWISVEAFGQALPDIAAATKVWRPLFTSEIDLVTEAIALIRQVWTE